MVKNFIKNNKTLFKLALDFKEPKGENKISLDKSEQAYLDELNKYGVVVIPNFYSSDDCKEMRKEFDNLSNEYSIKHDNDERIFGIEKHSPIFKKLHYDNEMFKRVGESYVNDKLILQTTMAAKIVPNKEVKYGSGGSWHRDSFSRQFKAIAYLDNVDKENGPFMYIKGSHKMSNIKKVIDQLKDHKPGDYRYTTEEIKDISKIIDEEITYFTAPEGTLILADIRGLHTGMPIQEGHRYAVFNYYIAKSAYQKDNKIEKLANNEY